MGDAGAIPVALVAGLALIVLFIIMRAKEKADSKARGKGSEKEGRGWVLDFLAQHRKHYPTALGEIKGGLKQSHWMWYIFPTPLPKDAETRSKLSERSRSYCIPDDRDALALLADKTFRSHLTEILAALSGVKEGGETNQGVLSRVFPSDVDRKKFRMCVRYFVETVREHGGAHILLGEARLMGLLLEWTQGQ